MYVAYLNILNFDRLQLFYIAKKEKKVKSHIMKNCIFYQFSFTLNITENIKIRFVLPERTPTKYPRTRIIQQLKFISL